MTLNVKNLELNANTAKTILDRAMRDRNMRITKAFVPSATSTHEFPIDARHKLKMTVNDNRLVVEHLAKIGNRWEASMTDILEGSIEAVQNAFAKVIEGLKNKA